MDDIVRPDRRDYEKVERKHGTPKSDSERADHYRLAQINK
jgi:hypothetical protein